MKTKTVSGISMPDQEVELQKMKGSIRHTMSVIQQGMNTSMVGTIVLGFQLVKVKPLIPHGQFNKWCVENIPNLTERSAQRAMVLANNMAKKKRGKIGKLNKRLIAAEPEEMGAEFVEEAAPLVADAFEGRTITELYQEFGVIKQKPLIKPPKKKQTAKEKAEGELKMARMEWVTVSRKIDMLGFPDSTWKETWKLLDLEEIETLQNKLALLARHMEFHLKDQKKAK